MPLPKTFNYHFLIQSIQFKLNYIQPTVLFAIY